MSYARFSPTSDVYVYLTGDGPHPNDPPGYREHTYEWRVHHPAIAFDGKWGHGKRFVSIFDTPQDVITFLEELRNDHGMMVPPGVSELITEDAEEMGVW